MDRASTPHDTLQAPGPRQALHFFTPHEARTVQAVMARIMPDDELGAGAVEAGAMYYADRALAGFEQSNQTRYRAGVRSLDAMCMSRFGTSFADCDLAQQDAVVGEMAAASSPVIDVAPGEAPWGLAFFELLRRHTLEGMFSDPIHGGNRDLSGWRLLGYPGPQPGYSHEEQQLGAVVVRGRIFTAADYPIATTDEPR